MIVNQLISGSLLNKVAIFCLISLPAKPLFTPYPSAWDRRELVLVAAGKAPGANLRLRLPEVYIDKAELWGITDQFYGTVKAKFVHKIGAVVLYGLGADEKFWRNLFAGKPFGQQAHDFLLPRG